MKDATAIIPTFLNSKGLFDLVDKLLNFDMTTIVIDNQPTKEKNYFFNQPKITSKVVYLPQKRNLGFAGSINLAVKHIKTPWFFILNDDVELKDKNIFRTLLKCCKKNKWAAGSPVLMKSKEEIENLGYQILPIGKIKLYTNLKLAPANSNQLDGLTAACLLFKTSVFSKIGGFDRNFYAYLEDVDLFIKLKLKKYRFGVCQNVTVIHHQMITSKRMGNFKQKQDLKNWCLLILKYPKVFRLEKLYLPSNFLNCINLILERFRNLSGYIKITLKLYRAKSIFIIPRDLIEIIKLIKQSKT